MLACWDAAIAARSTMLPGRSGTMTLIFASRPSLASPRRRMVERKVVSMLPPVGIVEANTAFIAPRSL